ncbi:MAG: outer membrane beta-barrel protein [Woeseiaceae bacterium]|nr:outer membrane beta-barrel protein [Woeseiaceae bacterium]
MKKLLMVAAVLALPMTATAQSVQKENAGDLSYNFAEIRFVDVDESDGDGLRFAGSFEINDEWILVGGLTLLDFDFDIDSTTLEIGGGYVWNYSDDFDLVSTLRYVRVDFDTPLGDFDDSGFALSSGIRGFIAPQFEIRGSANYINVDDSDTFIELAGDYYFTDQISAGISLQLAGDADVFSIGARWYFR